MKTGRRVWREMLLGGLAAMLLFPAAATLATAGLLIAANAEEGWRGSLNRDAPRACLWGTLIGLGFCLAVGGLLGRRFGCSDRASLRTYGELRVHFDQLNERVTAGCNGRADTACAVAATQIAAARRALVGREVGLCWLAMTGYVDLWQRLHRVEEALIAVEPASAVLGEADADELRLTGSRIPQGTALLGLLRKARAVLVGEVAESPPPRDEAEARAMLVEVRKAINDYRDARRAGLVEARNRVLITVVFTGLTGYALLLIAILNGATANQVTAAASFYLVGGLAGLARRLQSAPAVHAAGQDDFGLANALLLHTPLFSGVAAIGGVVLTKIAADGTAASLSEVFDLGRNPLSLVTAAVFGLTPALLITQLEKRAADSRHELAQTNSSSGDDTTVGSTTLSES